jgi:ribosome-associated translation inhibitor RaiA
MIIQLNTDKNLTIHQEYRNKLESLLTEELSRYSDHITRLEVHLSDENGSKSGANDKRCLLEVRLAGKKPIAVADIGNTHDLSLIGALAKLKPSLETIYGRMKSH